MYYNKIVGIRAVFQNTSIQVQVVEIARKVISPKRRNFYKNVLKQFANNG